MPPSPGTPALVAARTSRRTAAGPADVELLGENPAEGRAEDVYRFVLLSASSSSSNVRARPCMRRGRRYRSSSSLAHRWRCLVCTPCGFSESYGCAERLRFAPMPLSSSSGRPAPRIDVRSLTLLLLRIESLRWPLPGLSGQAPAQVTLQADGQCWMVCPGSVKDLEVAHVVGNALFEPYGGVPLPGYRRSGFRRRPDQRPGSRSAFLLLLMTGSISSSRSGRGGGFRARGCQGPRRALHDT